MTISIKNIPWKPFDPVPADLRKQVKRDPSLQTVVTQIESEHREQLSRIEQAKEKAEAAKSPAERQRDREEEELRRPERERKGQEIMNRLVNQFLRHNVFVRWDEYKDGRLSWQELKAACRRYCLSRNIPLGTFRRHGPQSVLWRMENESRLKPVNDGRRCAPSLDDVNPDRYLYSDKYRRDPFFEEVRNISQRTLFSVLVPFHTKTNSCWNSELGRYDLVAIQPAHPEGRQALAEAAANRERIASEREGPTTKGKKRASDTRIIDAADDNIIREIAKKFSYRYPRYGLKKEYEEERNKLEAELIGYGYEIALSESAAGVPLTGHALKGRLRQRFSDSQHEHFEERRKEVRIDEFESGYDDDEVGWHPDPLECARPIRYRMQEAACALEGIDYGKLTINEKDLLDLLKSVEDPHELSQKKIATSLNCNQSTVSRTVKNLKQRFNPKKRASGATVSEH